MGRKIGSMYWDIEAKTDKLDGGLKTSKATVKSFGEQVNTSMMNVYAGVQLAKMAFDAVAGAVKEVYLLARAGADLEFISSKFDNLTASIGTTSDALLRDLRKATDGTLSDMDLMASATDFLSLGLADSHDEVVRLSSVAGQLGMNMNQLVLTLTNQTTMRFDALGVSVSGFDEKVQKLKDSGMSANDAFNEAFLQQAEEQILRVGSATEESIGTFMRFEASIKDLSSTAKTKFSPAVEGIIETLTEGINVLGGQRGWNELLDEANDIAGNSKASYEDYLEGVNVALEGTGLFVDELGDLRAANIDGVIKLRAAKENMILYSEEAFTASQATEEWTTHEKKLYDQFLDTIPAMDDLTQATIATKDATNDASMAMRTYTDDLLFSIASQGLTAEQALSLAGAMGLVDEKTVMATEKTKLYKDWLDKGLITWGEYEDIVIRTGIALDAMPDSIYTDVFITIHGYDELQELVTMGGGGSGGAGFEQKALGGGVLSGQPVQWGEYGRTEMFMPNTSGQVVNAQQIVESLRSSGVNLGGDKPGIGTINVYTNSGVDAIQYSIQRAQGYAL